MIQINKVGLTHNLQRNTCRVKGPLYTKLKDPFYNCYIYQKNWNPQKKRKPRFKPCSKTETKFQHYSELYNKSFERVVSMVLNWWKGLIIELTHETMVGLLCGVLASAIMALYCPCNDRSLKTSIQRQARVQSLN